MPRCSTIIATLSILVLGQSIRAGAAETGVRLQIRDRLPVVDGVFLNGHGPYRFVLDTGAAVNQIEPALAGKLGMTPTFKSQLGSSTTGWTFVTGTEDVSVVLEGARADNQMFVFASLESLRLGSNDIQGVLGQEFLSTFDYLLDVASRRLEFRAIPPAAQKGTRANLTMVDGRPAVNTSLGRLILDSGADVLVRFNAAGGIGVRQIATLTGTMSVSMVRSTLVIEGRTFWKGDAVAAPRQAGSGSDGLLPALLFKTVYVSNSEGYLVLN